MPNTIGTSKLLVSSWLSLVETGAGSRGVEISGQANMSSKSVNDSVACVNSCDLCLN